MPEENVSALARQWHESGFNWVLLLPVSVSVYRTLSVGTPGALETLALAVTIAWVLWWLYLPRNAWCSAKPSRSTWLAVCPLLLAWVASTPWAELARLHLFFATTTFIAFYLPTGRALLIVFVAELALLLTSQWFELSFTQATASFWVTLFTMSLGTILRVACQALFRADRMATSLESLNEALERSVRTGERLATSNERNRFAQEMHDSLGHYLTTSHIQLELAKRRVGRDTEAAHDALERARDALETGRDELRDGTLLLRGLDRELPELLASTLERTAASALEVTCSVRGEPRNLDPRTTLVLFRASQELLTNVLRHANAKAVDVELHYEPHTVTLVVDDDGGGAPEALEHGNGLQGIRERLDALGGAFTLASSPRGGLRATVSVRD